MTRLKIIFPSGAPKDVVQLESNLSVLRHDGFDIPPVRDISNLANSLTAGSIDDRAKELQESILDRDRKICLVGRGGYGGADILPLLDWPKLKKEPTLIVGFSDCSAFHAAFYTRLSWKGLHGPMPSLPYWQPNAGDVVQLKNILKKEEKQISQIDLEPLQRDHDETLSGPLFGGCFSVLTNLIGTPWFPSLKGHLLFLEDISEPPGRLLRSFSQWLQSGVLEGVKGIILGSFKGCIDGQRGISERDLKNLLADRSPTAAFSTEAFGHQPLNTPIPIGIRGTIKGQKLSFNPEDLYDFF